MARQSHTNSEKHKTKNECIQSELFVSAQQIYFIYTQEQYFGSCNIFFHIMYARYVCMLVVIVPTLSHFVLVGFCFHKYFRRCNTFACLIKLKYFVCTMQARRRLREIAGFASHLALLVHSLSFVICNQVENLLFLPFRLRSLHPNSQPTPFPTALFACKIHIAIVCGKFLQGYTSWKPEVGIYCLCGSFQNEAFSFFLCAKYWNVAFEC